MVLATGGMLHRWSPPALEGLPSGLALHSAEVSDPKTLVGRDMDMVVVGSGQWAVLLAALLHEAGARVRLAARTDAINWNGVPRHDAPLAERLLRPDSGLGTGWKAWVYSGMPRACFYRFPPHLRRQIVTNKAGRPRGLGGSRTGSSAACRC